MQFTAHAVQRMTERQISKLDVHQVITRGDRFLNKNRTIAFEHADVRVIVDPLVPAVITAIRV